MSEASKINKKNDILKKIRRDFPSQNEASDT